MEGGQGGTNSQEFPRIKERRKNVMWRRCAERQRPGGSDGGAVGASGRNGNSGRQSEREGHASKNLASKKKCRVTTDGTTKRKT